jgi:hypothetical protein
LKEYGIDFSELRQFSGSELTDSFIHMISAWCNESNLVLGQQKVYEKSNEINAIPKLLDVLFIEGAVILQRSKMNITALLRSEYLNSLKINELE